MATGASRMLHLLPLLLLLAAAALAATADEEQPLPITLPGCPDKCGNVSIPYPFGIKAGCFLPGFEVVCNETFDPPRPFLDADKPISVGKTATKPYMLVANYYYWSTQPKKKLINKSLSPVELVDISVSPAQVRVHGALSFDCRANETYHSTRVQIVDLPGTTPFLVSQEGNVLLVIGRKVEANMIGDCQSLRVRTAGRCLGKGWCQGPVQVNTRASTVEITLGSGANDTEWRASPCSYGMVVENSWYSFTPEDLDGDSFLQRNAARGVPVVLHFAIRDVECPAEGDPAPEDYGCVSGNSECVDGHIPPSHYCTCSDGFHGNPYIPDGCQDINECKQPEQYPCYGKCDNTLGGYECTCPPGTRGNATAGHCTDIFPLPAKVSLGLLGCLFLVAVLALHTLLRREKRKMMDFFEKNGGPTLEKPENIKIYKKEELKTILKSSNRVGKGGFGEVYKGLLDNQLVAVKKPISIGNVSHNEQFANEVIIQSQVNHRNIVRLKGCCLEVDIPMLVYEFLPNGSLDDILHGNTKKPLNLDKRLSIAAESADGLAYMHSKARDYKILHGDVKPANILLDDNFMPKISDFGISRLIAIDKQHTNAVIGDRTYMDPVYMQTGLLTDKSDVYSSGVVLLEIISRKKATYTDNNSLVRNFLEAHKKEKRPTELLFDKEIAIESDPEHLNSVAGIAVECLDLDVDQRPDMTDVAERLLILKRSRRE